MRARLSRMTAGWLSGLALASPLYLLVLLVAAARRRPSAAAGDDRPSLSVLVPAHDEEQSVGILLRSLAATDYPRERLDVIVVADNCSDRTAEVARRAGAHVTERTDRERRGKGFAIAHGIAEIRSRATPDALVLVDADCEVTPNFLTAIADALARGASVVQTDNEASGEVQRSAIGLASIGITLMNRIRPEGKTALGMSAGLLGTGMAFTMTAVDAIDWGRPALAEDVEQHVQLVLAGHRVTYAGSATVTSALSTSQAGWRQQQTRWEAGRWQAVRRYVPRLLAEGTRRRDPQVLVAALDLAIPPQSAIASLSLTSALAATLAGNRGARRASLSALVAQAAFVLGGLVVTEAPASSYVALLHAPVLVAKKLGLYLRIGTGRSSQEWVRGERPAPTSGPPSAAP